MEKFIFFFEQLYVKVEPHWFELSIISVLLISYYLYEKKFFSKS